MRAASVATSAASRFAAEASALTSRRLAKAPAAASPRGLPPRARRVDRLAPRASADDARREDGGAPVGGVFADDVVAPRGMGFAPSSTSSLMVRSTPLASLAPLFLLADGGLSDDIKPSYFATLGLFVLSAPGLWSLVKRSAKSKVDRKTFEVAGPSAEAAMPLDELAQEIFMFFKRNNYVVADAGEVITFEGNIAPERGTAAYITFCVAIGLLCVALVCSIALPGGNAWYAMALASPLAGTYYMDNAGRKEQVKVKMVTADDDMTTDVIVEGDVEEIERMRRDLNLVEKGKVYVKGILEQ